MEEEEQDRGCDMVVEWEMSKQEIENKNKQKKQVAQYKR